jgi:hypothetical protein
MSTISATRLSSLVLPKLVPFDLNVALPACASPVMMYGVVEGSVALRPRGTAVVCTILAVEEWVEEVIFEKAAVDGIEVVVFRAVVVLGVVVVHTVVVLGVVVICSVVETIVVDGRLVVLVV